MASNFEITTVFTLKKTGNNETLTKDGQPALCKNAPYVLPSKFNPRNLEVNQPVCNSGCTFFKKGFALDVATGKPIKDKPLVIQDCVERRIFIEITSEEQKEEQKPELKIIGLKETKKNASKELIVNKKMKRE